MEGRERREDTSVVVRRVRGVGVSGLDCSAGEVVVDAVVLILVGVIDAVEATLDRLEDPNPRLNGRSCRLEEVCV